MAEALPNSHDDCVFKVLWIDPPIGHGLRRPQQAISTLECSPDMAEALSSSPDDCFFKVLWIDPPCWPWFKGSITRNFKFGQSYVDGRPSKGVSRSRGEVMLPSNRNDALVTKEEGTMHLSDEGTTVPAEKRELWKNGAQKALQWRRERERRLPPKTLVDPSDGRTTVDRDTTSMTERVSKEGTSMTEIEF
ncbi:hypothetical protein LR48_Vigan11g139700 [Vigna angularis]|uniref:Uncharacterized protein n=1 Tax=Phaseolus angularis TaxID=3914 RepID=A0A0L9VTU8_PHAAN|nr:hypothetical protein LR48_Vigan11g139700 [Vigna angularis]